MEDKQNNLQGYFNFTKLWKKISKIKLNGCHESYCVINDFHSEWLINSFSAYVVTLLLDYGETK